MKRSRKSKGVSWAHGVNLCQVKLFSSEDCPSKVGLISPDHLQEKTPWMLHPLTAEFNDYPPGFEVTPSGTQLPDLSSFSLIKWSCPLKFIMNSNWCVAAGEESKEIESQKSREMRFLEAVYPRASAIPPGSTVSNDIEDEIYDDSLTPLVPITPIEEDDCEELESDSAVVRNSATRSMPVTPSNIQLEPAISVRPIETSAGEKQPIEKLPDVGVGVDVDVAAAASTALAVLMKSMEQGSMIDTNLLIEIFSDPKMIQNLAVSGSPSIAMALPKLPNGSLSRASNGFESTVSAALSQMSTIPTSDANVRFPRSHLPAPDPNKVKITVSNARNYSKIVAVPAQANIEPVNTVSKGQQWKDLNYYKNLVRQHGDQRYSNEQKHGNNQNNHHNLKAENLKPRNQKLCNYFNTPQGCRYGVNCQFKHDITYDNQNAKRMKLEVTRRN